VPWSENLSRNDHKDRTLGSRKMAGKTSLKAARRRTSASSSEVGQQRAPRGVAAFARFMLVGGIQATNSSADKFGESR